MEGFGDNSNLLKFNPRDKINKTDFIKKTQYELLQETTLIKDRITKKLKTYLSKIDNSDNVPKSTKSLFLNMQKDPLSIFEYVFYTIPESIDKLFLLKRIEDLIVSTEQKVKILIENFSTEENLLESLQKLYGDVMTEFMSMPQLGYFENIPQSQEFAYLMASVIIIIILFPLISFGASVSTIIITGVLGFGSFVFLGYKFKEDKTDSGKENYKNLFDIVNDFYPDITQENFEKFMQVIRYRKDSLNKLLKSINYDENVLRGFINDIDNKKT